MVQKPSGSHAVQQAWRDRAAKPAGVHRIRPIAALFRPVLDPEHSALTYPALTNWGLAEH